MNKNDKKKYGLMVLVPLATMILSAIIALNQKSISYGALIIIVGFSLATIIYNLIPRTDAQLLEYLLNTRRHCIFTRKDDFGLLFAVTLFAGVIALSYPEDTYSQEVAQFLGIEEDQLISSKDVLIPSSLRDKLIMLQVGTDLQEKLLSNADSNFEHYPESTETSSTLLALVCKYANEILDDAEAGEGLKVADEIEQFTNYIIGNVDKGTAEYIVIFIFEMVLFFFIIMYFCKLLTFIVMQRYIPKNKTLNDVINSLQKKEGKPSLEYNIIECFEELLDAKGIEIPCTNDSEEQERHEDGNEAKLYGTEYWNLVNAVTNCILEDKSNE